MKERSMKRYSKQGGALIPRSKQRGMTLLEALIAALVIAVGLLGLAGLQLNGMRYSQAASSLSIATQLAEEMAERLRANLDSVADYQVSVTRQGRSCGGEEPEPSCADVENLVVARCFGGCVSDDNIKKADIDAVQRKMCTSMPCGSELTVSCDTSGVLDQCRVTLTWSDIESEGSDDTNLTEGKDLHLDVTPVSPYQ
jgi:type IV pilus assembly protein PilV